MYSQKGNFAGLVPNSYIHVSVRDLYIPRSVHLFCCSQIGHAVLFLGKFLSRFRYSVFAVQSKQRGAKRTPQLCWSFSSLSRAFCCVLQLQISCNSPFNILGRVLGSLDLKTFFFAKQHKENNLLRLFAIHIYIYIDTYWNGGRISIFQSLITILAGFISPDSCTTISTFSYAVKTSPFFARTALGMDASCRLH